MVNPLEIAEVLEACASDWREGTVDWCQGSYARDRNGVPSAVDWPEATSFCAEGNITRVCDRKSSFIDLDHAVQLSDQAKYALSEQIHGSVTSYARIVRWNDADDRTKEQVIDMFEQTAKDLRNNAAPGDLDA